MFAARSHLSRERARPRRSTATAPAAAIRFLPTSGQTRKIGPSVFSGNALFFPHKISNHPLFICLQTLSRTTKSNHRIFNIFRTLCALFGQRAKRSKLLLLSCACALFRKNFSGGGRRIRLGGEWLPSHFFGERRQGNSASSKGAGRWALHKAGFWEVRGPLETRERLRVKRRSRQPRRKWCSSATHSER